MRKKRWSLEYDRCQGNPAHGTRIPHWAHGLCRYCYTVAWSREQRARKRAEREVLDKQTVKK